MSFRQRLTGKHGVGHDLFRVYAEASQSIRAMTAFSPRFLHGLTVGIALVIFFALGGQVRAQSVSTPALSPTSATSYTQFSVTVTDATSGASLYYTLDGTTPTTSSSTVTSGGTITITKPETLKVLGVKSGYANSTVASSMYAVTGQIVGGLSHSVALRSDGSVWAWGLNDYGEVGDGTTNLRYSPVQVETSTTGPTYLTGVTQVSAGNYFSMALKNDGTVWCWGSNGNGNLGNGTNTGSSVPVQVVEGIIGYPALTNVIAISAGAMQCFALKSNGTVWAWGKNNYGQLGDGTMTARSRAVQVTNLTGITIEAISAGYYHELALDSTGKVYAWGYNNDGQLGDGTTTAESAPEHISSLDSSGIVALAGGGYHSIALESNGTVLAWGLNSDGQVGDTTMVNRSSPTQVHGLGSSSGMIDIIAGGYHSLAIKSDGTVWGWGENDYGQLGVGNIQNSVVPVQMSGVSGTEVVGAGDSHTLVAKNNGTVYFCGENEYGQAGDGSGDRLTPVQATGLGSTSSMSLNGGYHTLAVNTNGTLWSFGANISGELGDTTTNEHLGPEQVSSLTNILSASTGEFFSLAVDNNGKLWSWGANDQGQLGNTSSGSTTPTQVSSLSGITSASAGPMYSLAVKNNGTLWAWGANYSGQLGFSSPSHTGTPTQVTGGFGSSADIVASAAGGNSSLAIDNSGNLWTWGANSYGQLGIGNSTGTSTPTEVTNLEGITKSAVLGQYHGLALDSSSEVHAWGADNSGQLGDGTMTMTLRTVPEHISTLDPPLNGPYVVSLAAGNTHSMALKSDGTVWVWGLNSDGQLGDGTRNSQDSPEMVSGLSGVIAISAGINSSMALKQDGTIASWGNDTLGQLSVGANYSVPMTIPGLNLYVGTVTPTVSITANNTNINLTQTETFTASVSETGCTVSYYLDSTLIGSSNSSTSNYAVSWAPPTWGNFTFTAVATDASGNTSYHSSPVTVVVPFDSDNNGLPDWWEIKYGIFGLGYSSTSSPDGNGYTLLQDFQAGADPTNYYSQPNGSGGSHIIVPTFTIVGGNNQTSMPGSFTPQPLVVSVTNSSGGAAMYNAPVTFTVTQGGGNVSATSGGSTSSTLLVRTNSSGQAQIYYQQPSGNNITSQISATTGGQSVNFVETSLNLGALPQITSPATVTAGVNVPFSYAITATNTPTSFTASGYPSGLSFSSTTGVISGTPTTTGIFNVNITATNSVGTGTGDLVINLVSSSAAPVINSSTTATATTGSTFAYQITANNNPTEFGATNLPTGLSINSTTGAISGTVATSGTFTINLSATNGSGTGTAVLTLTTTAPGSGGGLAPVITSSPTASGASGQSFTYSITATNSPTSYNAVSLPPGLTVNNSTGVISGTPTSGGTYSALISATNANGTASISLALTIAYGTPAITSSSTATATVGSVFSYLITATNSPNSFSASPLPAGLMVDATTGIISGTPTSTGSYTISLGATNGTTGSATLTLTILPAGLPALTSPTISYATVGQSFSYTIAASNSPTSFNATGLPNWATCSSTTGVISGTPPVNGTPSAVGTPLVTISATNSVGSSSESLLLVIQASVANVTTEVNLQAGVSPSPSYTTTSAGIANDSTSPTGYLFVGLSTSTEIDRTLLGFDLSSIPPTANVTGAELDIYGYADSAFTMDLYQTTTFTASTASWTANTPGESLLSSSISDPDSDFQAFVTSANFTAAVTSALNSGIPLYLLIKASSDVESEGLVNFFEVEGNDSYEPTYNPALFLTYQTSAPPVMYGTTLNITSGTAYTYQVGAVNTDANTTYSVSGLPSGLSIDSSGNIAGTTTAVGIWTATVSATNANGTGTTVFTVNVGTAPTITSSLTASGTANSSFGSYTIQSSGSPATYTAGNLPSGLTVNSQTGVISGTPGIDSAGTYNVTLTATNVYGTSTKTLVLTIAPTAPVITTPLATLAATQNDSIDYYADINVSGTYKVPCHGGATGFSLSGFDSRLNLSIDSAGFITGTPTITGSFSGTVTATNSVGSSTAPLTVTVTAMPVPVIPPQSASAVVGQNFSYYVSNRVTVAANAFPLTPTNPNLTTPTGGQTWPSGNALPSGLSMDSYGDVYGTPSGITQVTTIQDIMTAQDAAGTGSGPFTLTVFPVGPGIQGPFTAYANVGQNFSYTLSTVVYDATSTSATGLPNGLTFNNGVISGVPTTPGTSNITLSATDSTGTSTINLVLTVGQTINAQVGVPFSYQIPDNATPTNFQSTNLPSWLNLNAITGVLSGTPVAADNIPINVTVTDSTGTSTRSLTLIVVASSGDSQANFQQGSVPTTAYTVPFVNIVNDTQNPSLANQTFNTGNVITVGQTTATASSRSLLDFDLSSLPANATITSASLVLQTAIGASSGLPLSVEVHQALTPFSTTNANWADNNLYAGAILGSLIIDPSASPNGYTLNGTALFTQTVQQAYNQGGKLYLTLAAPSVEGLSTADYVGFVTGSSTASQNPMLKLTYTVGQAAVPVITSAPVRTGTVNVALSYNITATNNPQSYSASGLPAGLTYNPTTGVISGTVSSVSSTTATVSATNSTGTGSQSVTFNINNATTVTSLQVISGNNQVGAPSGFLAQPLVVEALANGSPLANALVTFSATPGQGALSSTGSAPTFTTLTVVTNASGQAVVYFCLPNNFLTTTIVASAGIASPVSLVETAASNIAASTQVASLSVVSGEGQSGPAGQALPQPFIIEANSANGQPVSSASLSLVVSQGGGSISGTSGGPYGTSLSLTTDGYGKAMVYLEPGGTNGTQNKVTCTAAAIEGSQPTVYLTALTAASTTPTTPTPGGGSPPTTDVDPPSLAVPVITITPFGYQPPSGDQDVDAYADYTHITISWNAIGGATSYLVERLDDSGVWETLTTTGSNSTTDQGLYSGIAYQYRVTAMAGTAKSQPGLQSYSVPLIAAVGLLGYKSGVWYDCNLEDVLENGFYYDNLLPSDDQPTEFKFILNPSRSAGTFSWYAFSNYYTSNGQYSYSSTTNPSSPTNIKQSSIYPVIYPNGSLQAITFGELINGTQTDGSSLDILTNEYGYNYSSAIAPGGVISQGGQANFSVDAGYYYYYELESLTIAYSGAGSSDFTVKDGLGNVIPAGGKTYTSTYPYGYYYSFGDYYFSVIPNSQTVQPGDSITITVSSIDEWGISQSRTFTYTYQANPGDFSIPIDESSGSRYRKIALNGLPMSDEKPQQSAESDQEKEETYIDALTLGLRHSTTDVYLPVSGSDFSVSARRDFRSQVWNTRHGLRPHEQPDLPFGMCWSSNLAPNIKLTHNNDPNSTTPDQAMVTDETGAVHSFYRWYDSQGNPQFFPMPSAKNEAQVPNLETLSVNASANPVTYTFTRKYGASLIYQTTTLSQSISNDRVLGSSYSTTYNYARLVQAVDRVGNTVNYQFQGTTNLIPATITVSNQPGIKLSIAQQPLSALISGSASTQSVITAIWDANGNKTTFAYTSAPGDPEAAQLASVTTPDGATTNYAYRAQSEADLTPHASSDPGSTYWYADIASISDPLNNTYGFSYALDHSKRNYMSNPQLYTGYFTQSGSPRNVTQVTMPDNTAQHPDVSTFTNNSLVWLQNAPPGQTGLVVAPNSLRQCQVTDATGFTRTYTFGNSTVIALPSFPQPGNSVTESKIIAYQNLVIGYGTLGSETFQFDINAAMALSQTTDFSGNVTTFNHESPANKWTAPATYSQIVSGATLNGYYDDPISQTDALQHTKTFAYDPATRIMTDVVDENQNHTHYDIDSLGRRTTEKLYDPNANLIQETDFVYGSSTYPGFMTQKTVKALGVSDPSWTQSLVTQYVPDANGRVAQEVVDPGGLTLTTSYTYDANGNKLSATDPRGNTTWFTYDSRNRLVNATYADGTQKQMVYDARGNKTKEIDENGYATLYAYDALNRLITQARDMNGNGVIDAPSVDLVTSYSYNAVNSKLSTTDPNLHTTNMSYDNLQRVVSITDAHNYTTQFQYGANSGGNAFDSASFKPTQTIDPRGYVTTVTYDALYRPTIKSTQIDTNGDQSVVSSQYDAVGNVVLSTDPLGHQTGTTYDALNRPILTTLPDTSTIQTAYTSTGLKWKVTDELGNVTQTEYDSAGRATEVIEPSVNNGVGGAATPITKTAYDAAGNVASTINPLGQEWDNVYDARNRKVQALAPPVLDAVSNTTLRPTVITEYDLTGNVVARTDARGNTTMMTYDPANRLVSTIEPSVALPGNTTGQPTTRQSYDQAGNVLTVTDPNNHTTTNVYDVLNRLYTSTDAAGITVTNTYDQVGNKLSVSDGKNQTTNFSYDGLNRNTSIIDAAGNSTTLRYDALNKTQRIDALGQITTYLYDVRNRLSNVVYNSGTAANSQRNYAYDFDGNLLSVTETSKTAANVVYAYDALNRVVNETSQGQTHSYVYDLAGNRLSTVYGGTNRTITSTYDALNRLSSMAEGTRTTNYAYDLNGNIVKKTAPNGDTEAYTYDAINRATDETAKTGTASLLCEYGYGFDLASNVTSVVETYPGGLPERTVNNTYDNINRLTQEAVTAAVNVTTAYVYDNANNRTSQVITGGTGAGTTNYSYNNLNQLTGYSNGTRSVALTYDLDGNRSTRVVTGGTDNGTDIYSYDFENRLIGLVKGTAGGGGTYAYTYDYRTRRIVRDESNAGGVVTNLVFSGGTSVQEYTGTISTADLTVEYIRGSDYGGGVGSILYTLRGGTPSYTHENKRGDVVAKTNASGSLTYQAQYAAFGNQTATSGSTLDRQKSNSKDTDPTNLVDEGFRYRDLETGMFITRDPAGFVDGPNLYTYVRQNPWTKFDPEGLTAWDRVEGYAQGVTNGLIGTLNFIKNTSPILALAPNIPEVHNENGATDKNDFISGENGGSVFFAGGSAVIGGVGGLAAKGPVLAKTGEEIAEDVAAGSPKPTESPAPGDQPASETAPAPQANEPVPSGTKCFAAGTLISTPHGDVSIETIRAGDMVWSLDIKTGHVIEKKVESIFSHVTEYWVDVTAGGEKITATRGHRFWVESLKKWIPAEELKPGMKLLGSSGHLIPITQVHVRHLSTDETTYNFFVSDTHTYFVGQHCWLVHNGDDDTSSHAARREAMRQQNIPTSQQPSSQRGDAAHKQYTYEVPAEGGGSQTKVVSHHEADAQHPDPHWEAAKAKTDDEGNVREGNQGQIKYESDKSKVTYTKMDKC